MLIQNRNNKGYINLYDVLHISVIRYPEHDRNIGLYISIGDKDIYKIGSYPTEVIFSYDQVLALYIWLDSISESIRKKRRDWSNYVLHRTLFSIEITLKNHAEMTNTSVYQVLITCNDSILAFCCYIEQLVPILRALHRIFRQFLSLIEETFISLDNILDRPEQTEKEKQISYLSDISNIDIDNQQRNNDTNKSINENEQREEQLVSNHDDAIIQEEIKQLKEQQQNQIKVKVPSIDEAMNFVSKPIISETEKRISNRLNNPIPSNSYNQLIELLRTMRFIELDALLNQLDISPDHFISYVASDESLAMLIDKYIEWQQNSANKQQQVHNSNNESDNNAINNAISSDQDGSKKMTWPALIENTLSKYEPKLVQLYQDFYNKKIAFVDIVNESQQYAKRLRKSDIIALCNAITSDNMDAWTRRLNIIFNKGE